MSYFHKYQAWINECQTIINARKQEQRKKLIASVVTTIGSMKQKRKYEKKQFWIHPIFRLRDIHGFYESIFPTISLYDSTFKTYMRMSLTEFKELFCIVGPLITKKYVIRKPIPAPARLALTLRFLATGDCMISTSFHYLIGSTTVVNIIAEVCKALWISLHKNVMPFPLEEKDWLSISEDFEKQWNFNHCIGAIDGKHIQIQCPDNSGSRYYNYKNCHSIVLLGICDANYLFTFVDIGACGRRSDGGTFKDSVMGQKFNDKLMNVPKPKLLTVGGICLPYVLVGDEAFQLTDYLLRPYPGRILNQDRRIFNYRLSRARRTIENTFGVLVSQWRVLKKPIESTVDNAINIVKAVVCLHNWVRKHGHTDEHVSSNDVEETLSKSSDNMENTIIHSHCNNSSRSAINIREEFCRFFNEEGAIPWQYEIQ